MLAAAAAAALAAPAALPAPPDNRVVRPATRVAPSAAPSFDWRGVGSCASSACHGGVGPLGSKGSEYTTWITRDPHARAYAVLEEARSRRIVESFRGQG